MDYAPFDSPEHAILTEECQQMFLKYSQRDKEKAMRCAKEWMRIYSALCFMVPQALHGLREFSLSPLKTMVEVVDFFRERQARRYFPGN